MGHQLVEPLVLFLAYDIAPGLQVRAVQREVGLLPAKTTDPTSAVAYQDTLHGHINQNRPVAAFTTAELNPVALAGETVAEQTFECCFEVWLVDLLPDSLHQEEVGPVEAPILRAHREQFIVVAIGVADF